MSYERIIDEAVQLVGQRGKQYGGIREGFNRAALIASATLSKPITPYEVATILRAVKQSRLSVDIGHMDSHLDGINYAAFAADLVGMPLAPELAALHSALSRPPVAEEAPAKPLDVVEPKSLKARERLQAAGAKPYGTHGELSLDALSKVFGP